jgi:HSP20 family protein
MNIRFAFRRSLSQEVSMANFPTLFSDDPFRAMARMRKEMDSLFGDFFSEPGLASFQPGFDIEDKESHFLLSFDVPGMSKNDVQIEVEGSQLHVFGERSQESRAKKGGGQRVYGSFDRWISLPQNVHAENIEAHMENGVLQLAIPKSEIAKPKRIQVGESKGGFFSRLLGRNDQDKAANVDKNINENAA